MKIIELKTQVQSTCKYVTKELETIKKFKINYSTCKEIQNTKSNLISIIYIQ